MHPHAVIIRQTPAAPHFSARTRTRFADLKTRRHWSQATGSGADPHTPGLQWCVGACVGAVCGSFVSMLKGLTHTYTLTHRKPPPLYVCMCVCAQPCTCARYSCVSVCVSVYLPEKIEIFSNKTYTPTYTPTHTPGLKWCVWVVNLLKSFKKGSF
jgi:hypothetical protein